MDCFLLYKILSHLEFYQVWKCRELSQWCKREIEGNHKNYLENINLEVRSEEDEFLLFPKESLIFKCVSYDNLRNIFKFEIVDNNNTNSNKKDPSTHSNTTPPSSNFVLPMFLKFWEKYCHCSISFFVNSRSVRSYYTTAIQNSTHSRRSNIWYKTDTVYHGLRARIADYDVFLDYYRATEIYKELIACGLVRTKSTQSKIVLMQEDVQRIIKELNLYKQPTQEPVIYMQATSSFLFPHLRTRSCVFPDRLRVLGSNEKEGFDYSSSMEVVGLKLFP